MFCATNFPIEFIIWLIRTFRYVQHLMVSFKVVWIHSLPKSTLFQNQDAKLQWNLSPMCLFMSFKNQMKVTSSISRKTKIEKLLFMWISCKSSLSSSFALSIRLSKCPLYCPSANFNSVIPMGYESMVQCLVMNMKLKTKSAYPFFRNNIRISKMSIIITHLRIKINLPRWRAQHVTVRLLTVLFTVAPISNSFLIHVTKSHDQALFNISSVTWLLMKLGLLSHKSLCFKGPHTKK